MSYPLIGWLKSGGAAAICLVAQVPQQAPEIARKSNLSAIDAYVRRVDADKRLNLKRHLHTYGHANKPGADSLFWIFHTDHQFSSANVYFSGSRIVKIVETVRGPDDFSEYSYYLRDSKLLLVKNRQVACPLSVQGKAWRSNILPHVKPEDYFFRGVYYFAHDSCISNQERGLSRRTPEYQIPGGRGRYAMPPEIFPLQTARYLICFPHPPVPKRH